MWGTRGDRPRPPARPPRGAAERVPKSKEGAPAGGGGATAPPGEPAGGRPGPDPQAVEETRALGALGARLLAASGRRDLLGPGWACEARRRRSGASAGAWDATFVHRPSGRRFRSRREVERFLLAPAAVAAGTLEASASEKTKAEAKAAPPLQLPRKPKAVASRFFASASPPGPASGASAPSAKVPKRPAPREAPTAAKKRQKSRVAAKAELDVSRRQRIAHRSAPPPPSPPPRCEQLSKTACTGTSPDRVRSLN